MVIQRYSIELISPFFFYTFASVKQRTKSEEFITLGTWHSMFGVDKGNISINILKERIYYDWVFCIFDDQLPQAWGWC